MYSDNINIVAESAYKKNKLYNQNFKGFLILSFIAGMYVCFGVLLSYSLGAYLHDFVAYKLIMAMFFSCALSFIYFAGGELFTGNTFIMTIGVATKKVNISTAIKYCIICFIGNLVGSILCAYIIYTSGLINESTGQFISDFTNIKTTIPPMQLFIRAIFCNILVSIATWCFYIMKSETAKLIMIFWCIVAFFTIGFEHCIANLSLLFLGILAPYDNLNAISGFFYNISIATIGNIIGGVILALAYLYTNKKLK